MTREVDAEVFYRSLSENDADEWKDEDGETMGAGWYWWYCLPGCLPNMDAVGPFATEAEANADVAREEEAFAPLEEDGDDKDEDE